MTRRPDHPGRADRSGHQGVKRYDHGYHMLMRDLEGKKVWSDVLDWVASGRSTPD